MTGLTLPLLIGAACAAGPVNPSPRILTVVNDVAEPVSLDPHRQFDASSENIINQIFDGLVRFSEDGRIEPALAESWRRVDERTMEFKLRPGVRFHNGEPFDAEAVRFSLARQLDPKNPAPNAALLGSVEVEVVDELTVRLRTQVPDGVLLNKLPLFVRIVPPRHIRAKGDRAFAERPIGTGPFMFERRVPKERIELKANPSYWMPGAPRVGGVTFVFLPLAEQLKALISGRVDMVTDLSGLDTMAVAKNPATRVLKAKNFYAVSLLFNTRKKPFSDARARRAVVHALDRTALIRYGAKGNAVPLKGLTMDGEFGHNPKVVGYPHDLARAKALLAEAGFGQGLKIKVQVREEIGNFGKIIAAQLAKAGIEADAYVVSQQRQFEELAYPKIKPGVPPWDGDIAVAHYVDPMVHSYFPYSIILYSKSPYSLVDEPAFDEIFLRMSSSLDPAEQQRLGQEAEELVSKECWSVSLLQFLRPYGLRRGVRYAPHVTGMLDFRTVEMEALP